MHTLYKCPSRHYESFPRIKLFQPSRQSMREHFGRATVITFCIFVCPLPFPFTIRFLVSTDFTSHHYQNKAFRILLCLEKSFLVHTSKSYINTGWAMDYNFYHDYSTSIQNTQSY